MSQTNIRPLSAYEPPATAENLKAVCKEVEQAIQYSTPTGRSHYSKVDVILVNWEAEDRSTTEELQCLESLFSWYGYNVEWYCIPSQFTRGHGEVQSRFLHWAMGTSDELKIFVYSGHARVSSEGEFHLYANSSIFSPAVNFNYVIRYSMITTYSDVLLVMNCCFASTVSLAPNMELLAASAGNEITPTPESAVSFPKVMHAAMRSFGGNQYTVAELHSMIMRANVTAATPVYVQRGTHKDGSILLPNLQRRTDEPPPKLFNQAEDDRILASIRNNRERYVLIKVTLSTAPTLASAEEFYRWLSTDMPSHVNDISLEGVFSGSGVLLIRLPIAVWSGIRDNSTFSFVCFVSSSNLMVPESSRRLQSSSGETSLPSSHFSAQSASSTAATDPHIEASPEREAGRQLSGSD